MSEGDYLLHKIYSVLFILRWTIFFVFHLILLVILLLIQWSSGATPHSVTGLMLKYYSYLHIPKILWVLKLLFGCALIPLIWGYALLWQAIFWKLAKKYTE